MRFETKVIHAGQEPEKLTGAVVVPIYQTSTYAQPAPGEHLGHEYTRTSNPTRDALQSCVAALEGGTHGIAFASGMAATSTVIMLLQSGDHVVSTADVYGGTFRAFDKVFSDFGITFTFVDTSDASAVAAAFRPTTKLLWVETPTNPLLFVSDIQQLAKIAHDRDALLCVDNTFMSPALQQPLALGADIVVHSTTKYLGGHSDVVGGMAVTKDDDLAEKVRFRQNAVGAVPGPFDSWLTLRGVRTLPLRMRAHEENAGRVARFLVDDPRVRDVLWPGLSEHPGHELQKRQASGFGGIVSFRVEGGHDAAVRVCSATRYFLLAESLGGVESLIEHPAIMTHASVPEDQRRERGITDDLIRLSVGVENGEDLLEDLDQALGT